MANHDETKQFLGLPDEPVDGYRVEWWQLLSDRLIHYEAIFHCYSRWSDVCPDGDVGGADFMLQWQLFDDGNARSRLVDWAFTYDWTGMYATEREAVGALVECLESTIEHCAKTIRESLMAREAAMDRLEEMGTVA